MEIALQNKELIAIISKAAQGEQAAQQKLFQTYASKMLSVCRYYINDLQYAEDVMITGFYKVFAHLATFRNEGSFEGWIRRIITREAISFLRQNKSMLFVDKEDLPDTADDDSLENNLAEYHIDTLQTLIDDLPDGYRTVFLLYVMEDYSHKEIANMLHISESTSKTQLLKAKKMLKNKLETIKERVNEFG